MHTSWNEEVDDGYEEADPSYRSQRGSILEGVDPADRPYLLTVMEEIAREKKEFGLSFTVKKIKAQDSGNELALTGVVDILSIDDNSPRCQ